MTDRQRGDAGLTRRELLKKGALLGGTLVWTTPVVQMIGMHPAMAETVSPVAELGDFSYVDILVACNGTNYRMKFERDENCWTEVPKDFSWENPTNVCFDPAKVDMLEYEKACDDCANTDECTRNVTGPGGLVVFQDFSAEAGPWSVTVDSDCEILDAVIKCADCANSSSSFVTISGDKHTVTFSSCPS